jgi:lysophospholipase L1-like esterase
MRRLNSGGVEQTRFRSTAHILGLNRWIAEHAESRGHVFLDFHIALANWQGRLDVRFTTDGLHLNADGYARMAEVLTAARP